MLIYGRHRWATRTVAFRGDYCLSCDSCTVSRQVSTLDFFHVYWVPLLPLGRWKHWHCQECGCNPHERVRMGRGYKLVGAIACLVVFVMSFLIPMEPDAESTIWGMRVGGGLLFAAFCFAWWIHNDGSLLTEKLMAVPEFRPTICLACDNELVAHANSCPFCFVRYDESPPL